MFIPIHETNRWREPRANQYIEVLETRNTTRCKNNQNKRYVSTESETVSKVTYAAGLPNVDREKAIVAVVAAVVYTYLFISFTCFSF